MAQPTSDRRPRRRVRASHVFVSLTVGISLAVSAAVPAYAVTDSVTADFSTTTGSVFGGAGALYGMSDNGVPSSAVEAGANPGTLTQKAPNGLQHPNGDPLQVANEFFATGGKYMFVYLQDAYADWPYNGGVRPTDFSTYLSMITTSVQAIKTADPANFSKYVFVPFNEPDGGNWYANYSTMETQFLADWGSAYSTIKAVDSTAKIGGPSLANYSHARLSDLISYGKANNDLPNFVIWHELNRQSLANYRSNYTDYRAIETADGVSAIPINVNEWGDRSDLSVPGQLIQWISMFEATKVYGNTAYWTYAGNLNDNASQGNSANGGWWLEKWYADLTGSTVSLTPPALNTPQTVQGIAALDNTKKQATVILGGGSNNISLNLANLSTTTFGSTVDVTVARDTWSGYDGSELQPKVIQTQRFTLGGTTPTITIPNSDPMSAYQVIVTPALATAPVVDTTWSTSVNAANTTLTSATVYSQDTDANPQLYATSGKEDVGNLSTASSALAWTVTVPSTGTYQLSVYDGANAAPGQQALFVDGTFNQLIQYTADLGYTYRNRTNVTLSLSAGSHTLSVRTSQDGTTILPGSNITINKFDLTQVPGVVSASYPARFARVIGTPSYVSGQGVNGELLTVSSTATGQFFLTVPENGYYDLAVDYRTPNGAASLTTILNGRTLTGFGSTGAGGWTSTARVHLPEGVSELRITSPGVAQLDTVRTVRATAGDSSTHVIEAENATLAGAVVVNTLAAGTNASGGKDVGYVGNGAANTVTITRPSGTGAGQYDLDVRYANNAQNTASHYNTDVITRFLTVTETGGSSVVGAFRNDFSWTSMWWHTVPLTLTTASGSLVLGNTSAYAPDLDEFALSPLELSSSTTTYNG